MSGYAISCLSILQRRCTSTDVNGHRLTTMHDSVSHYLTGFIFASAKAGIVESIGYGDHRASASAFRDLRESQGSSPASMKVR